MFKIGEFSKIVQVSIRMLRYYDEQKLLVPQCVDSRTGYRLYAASQIEEMSKIIFLRNMGFGVEQMKKMLQSWDTESTRLCLLDQMEKSNQVIKAEELKRKQMQTLINELDYPSEKCGVDIVLKQLPLQQVISMRKTVPDYYCEGQMWQELTDSIVNIHEVQKMQSFTIYHDLDYREKDVDIEICINNEGTIILSNNDNIISRQVLAVDVSACFFVYGPYSNISKAYQAFGYWLEQHSEYVMCGENRQICHVSMCHTEDPTEYITELQIPLKPISE